MPIESQTLDFPVPEPAYELPSSSEFIHSLYQKSPLVKKVSTKVEALDVGTSFIYQTYPVGSPMLNEARSFIAGIECEIEGVHPNKGKSVAGFECKGDHSLRNNGYEWISPPWERDQLVSGFTELHKFLKCDPAKDPFSYRTSVHVHVNCCSLTQQQTKNLMLLYALYEEMFFTMVKPVRRANIHCVPLTETFLPTHYNKQLNYIRQIWSKYAALNLCRLSDLGTVEFRHHHGTGDTDELNTWLKVLENLWNLSRQVVIDEEALSNPTRIYSWFDTIFNPSEKTMMLGSQLHNIIHNSLIDVKFSTIKEGK